MFSKSKTSFIQVSYGVGGSVSKKQGSIDSIVSGLNSELSDFKSPVVTALAINNEGSRLTVIAASDRDWET